MDLILNVEPRTEVRRNVRNVRAAGYVPGVVYGQGKAAQPMKFKEIDLVRLLRSGAATQLIEIKGLSQRSMHVLMRDMQREPTRRNMLHVDFYQVQMDVAVRTEVPVHFIGESEAIKGGAVLLHNLERIDVECLPADIPEAFVADLAALENVGDVIKVSDLSVAEGVIVHSDADEVVVSLSLPRKLAEDEEEDEFDEDLEIGEPEIISRGREEEEDEG